MKFALTSNYKNSVFTSQVSTCNELKMVKKYAMKRVSWLMYNTPNTHVRPRIHVKRVHALAQYLCRKQETNVRETLNKHEKR